MNHCVHDVRRSPSRPERLFMQFHDGVYRSDDGGASWIDIGTDTALPSDFGFPIVVDPADPDSAFVIPLIGAEDRTTPGGSVKGLGDARRGRVVEPSRRRASRAARIPHVLREVFDTAGEGKGLQLYFGATSGDVFGSDDGGATWGTVAEHLAPVYSVRTA